MCNEPQSCADHIQSRASISPKTMPAAHFDWCVCRCVEQMRREMFRRTGVYLDDFVAKDPNYVFTISEWCVFMR